MTSSNLFRVSTFFLFIILYSGLATSRAQDRKVPRILQRLMHQNSFIPIILSGNEQIIHPDNRDQILGRPAQSLIKTKDHLFCNVDGTGWLYTLTDSNGLLKAERVDSTFYQGNSFGALHFSDGVTIYSYGGYGFWRTNGLLRKFNPYTREWDIVKIEEEVPYSKGYLNWLDTANNKLYFSLLKFHQDGFEKQKDAFKHYENKLFVLDLKTGKWVKIARLTNFFNGIQVPCKWGTLSLYGPDSVVVLDYLNNELRLLRKELIPQFNKVFSPQKTELYYCIDSTMYFGSLTYDLFDSIHLSASDLIPTGKKFYTEEVRQESGAEFPYGWMAVTLFMGVACTFLFMRKPVLIPDGTTRRGSTKNGTPTGVITMAATADPYMLFTPVEINLIHVLLDHATKGEDTTQEELNNLLGLSAKKLSIQKKNRNDVINSINQKWGLLQHSTEQLIERKRSPTDMRVYSYNLNKEALDRLSHLLESTSADKE